MSGGGYTPPPRTPSGGSDGLDCLRLTFTCTLTSVDPVVLAATSVGDICEVVLDGSPPGQTIRVLAVDDEVLGAIVDHWAELSRCISAGVAYVAEVRTVTSPVRVTVRPT